MRTGFSWRMSITCISCDHFSLRKRRIPTQAEQQRNIWNDLCSSNFAFFYFRSRSISTILVHSSSALAGTGCHTAFNQFLGELASFRRVIDYHIPHLPRKTFKEKVASSELKLLSQCSLSMRNFTIHEYQYLVPRIGLETRKRKKEQSTLS